MVTVQTSLVAIRNVAVATDFSECTERAMQHGLAVARHFGATLHFLHIVRPSQFPYTQDVLPVLGDAAVRDFDQLIGALQRTHRLDGIEFRQRVVQGEIRDIMSNFVREQHVDLLIVGTHGRSGIPRLLRGSVAQQIFHYVRCPVLVVGPRSRGAGPQLRLKRILFSTDLSGESLAAIPYVLTAMREWHTELDVLHVCSAPRAEHSTLMGKLNSEIDSLLEGKDHASFRCHLLTGKPAPCITGFADRNNEDLIVLGLKPRRDLYSGPLWSHAYEIMRHAGCPVLSVRSSQARLCAAPL